MNKFLTGFKTLAVIFSAISVVSVVHAQSGTVWDGIYTGEQATRGEVVYEDTCIACHGQDLGGNSNSPGLVGMGFMFLWEGRTLGAFFEKIREDMPTDRPGQLPAQDYLDVVAYIMQANSFPVGDNELPRDIEALNGIAIAPKP